jgi:alkylation response protein AidB-like acyl-CoA dehydrogenase
MDLELTAEQQLMQITARAALGQHCTVDRVVKVREQAVAFDQDLWQLASDLGWPSVTVAPPWGLGLTMEDALILLHETGRALAPIPLASSLLAAHLVGRHGDPDDQAELLPGIASGQTIAAVVHRRRSDGSPRAAFAFNDARLSGSTELVRDAQIADILVALVDVDNELQVAVIPTVGTAVAVRPQLAAGAMREGICTVRELALSETMVLAHPVSSSDSDGFQALIDLFEAAETIGACEYVIELAADHASSRVQFGRPIGSFQAVQHRLADAVIDLYGCRWLAWRVASEMAAGRDAATLAAQLSVWTRSASARIVAAAHQIHGGIGFIREHPLHLYFGRQKATELSGAPSAAFRERVAAAVLGPLAREKGGAR